MKTYLVRIGLIAAIAAAVVIGLAGLINRPANAASGNQGIPVRCYVSSAGVAAGADIFMTCLTPLGSPPLSAASAYPAATISWSPIFW